MPAILSGLEIQEAYQTELRHRKYLENCPFSGLESAQRLWIDDFDESRVNPNSYNLRLAPELLCYCVNHRLPLEAGETSVLDMQNDNPTNSFVIPKEGLILLPGILYLGRTLEFTATHNLVPCIEGRSSVARLGLSVHLSAGYGDAGFAGTFTLELTVVHPLRVYAGVAVCQIQYSTISGHHVPYKSTKGYNDQRLPVASRLWKELVPAPAHVNPASDDEGQGAPRCNLGSESEGDVR